MEWHDITDYDIDCLGMSIVNHTNEINKVSVEDRQLNNDECFDYAKERIKMFIEAHIQEEGYEKI